MEDSQVDFPDELFQREDESPDPLFYTTPRLLVHLDADALMAVQTYLGEVLPPHGVILDLMSSWRSHLPESYVRGRLVGLGLNRVELDENPQLDERIVRDVNANPLLPFEASCFDAAMVTVSIQYLTKPVEVFRELRRVLKPGAAFHVIYSDRMFPTKAVAIWRAMPDAARRARLIADYFDRSGGWDTLEHFDRSPSKDPYTDPVYVARAQAIRPTISA